MRKFSFFIASVVVIGFLSCNNQSTSNNAATSDSTQTHEMSQDHMAGMDAGVMSPVPVGAKVFFKNLKDGQDLKSPFSVEMGVEGMKVVPAGMIEAGTGHHHILIDAGDSLMAGMVVPSDSSHLHFGKGQTETELSLSPGKHTLTLQFADGAHRSYGSQLAATITVNVKK